MPSIYEGFGIPVIEAMNLNTPVISSNIDPLKEVIQNNGFYFDPTNQEELIHLLINFEKLNSQEIKKITDQAKIRADIFSWANTAKSVISVFEKFKK
jgi:glycosyltransferase involved in cell wall biosynthesis